MKLTSTWYVASCKCVCAIINIVNIIWWISRQKIPVRKMRKVFNSRDLKVCSVWVSTAAGICWRAKSGRLPSAHSCNHYKVTGVGGGGSPAHQGGMWAEKIILNYRPRITWGHGFWTQTSADSDLIVFGMGLWQKLHRCFNVQFIWMNKSKFLGINWTVVLPLRAKEIKPIRNITPVYVGTVLVL